MIESSFRTNFLNLLAKTSSNFFLNIITVKYSAYNSHHNFMKPYFNVVKIVRHKICYGNLKIPCHVQSVRVFIIFERSLVFCACCCLLSASQPYVAHQIMRNWAGGVSCLQHHTLKMCNEKKIFSHTQTNEL